MNKIERLERIKLLFTSIGGEIIGRKKLHKLAYLYQMLGVDLGQDFIFHYYGVYSPSLSNDLQQAESWGIIDEEINTEHPWKGFKIKLIEENLQIESNLPKKDDIHLLASKPAVVLEVLSTIVYLHDRNYCEEKIQSKLYELKGHLSSHFEEAKALAKSYFGIFV